MKIIFPKQEYHLPKWFIINAQNKILGRLASNISKILMGKETSAYSFGINQGNFVTVLNAGKIKLTGQKKVNKLYMRNSQRPGSLKIETFNHLQARFSTRILEKAVRGMLPKSKLGDQYYKRFHVFAGSEVPYQSNKFKSIFSPK